mmetsp:Transcript_27071/g.68013  ORF Transcript_27071/g.68013 Transcript_27071/m.68013 type:complete len:152 (-) Transcript_27071:36-491(-)|eukprot:CAMPEP_0177669346 /NCGR_PEP_ID=MMETSP0447-20121125/23387_1 /TAXON_ID=0 /ORGANISM="Stygamoeba regulata, Strain BSH-02190019" /LENGTH=151 /DNA_ID=CAMNT_0019176197 /DNA_START=28 /DNA_END=483 /DNA_ORIENTATION=+
MSANPRCPGCGKVAYFAERQVYEKETWHQLCLREHMKTELAYDKARPFQSKGAERDDEDLVVDVPFLPVQVSAEKVQPDKILTGAPTQCPLCQKNVFFNERAPFEGQNFHPACLLKWKESESFKSKSRPFQRKGAENPNNYVKPDIAHSPQ